MNVTLDYLQQLFNAVVDMFKGVVIGLDYYLWDIIISGAVISLLFGVFRGRIYDN